MIKRNKPEDLRKQKGLAAEGVALKLWRKYGYWKKL